MFKRISLLSFVAGALLQVGGCQGNLGAEAESLDENANFTLYNHTSCPLYLYGYSGTGNFVINGITQDSKSNYIQPTTIMCPQTNLPVKHTVTHRSRSGTLFLRTENVINAENAKTSNANANNVVPTTPGCNIAHNGNLRKCSSDMLYSKDGSNVTVSGTVKCSEDADAQKACQDLRPTKTMTLVVSNHSTKNIFVAASETKGSVSYNNGQSILGSFDPSDYIQVNYSMTLGLTTKEAQFSGFILFATSVSGTTNCSLGLSALGTDKQEIIRTDLSLCCKLQPCNGGSCTLNIYDEAACQ